MQLHFTQHASIMIPAYYYVGIFDAGLVIAICVVEISLYIRIQLCNVLFEMIFVQLIYITLCTNNLHLYIHSMQYLVQPQPG